MDVSVETRNTASGDVEPVSFSIGTRLLQVDQVLDRWPGPDHSYFKVAASDGALYILRHASDTREWEMHWFSAG